MKKLKNILSKIFVVFVTCSQVLPTSTLTMYADETSSHTLTVQVVGEANVTVSTSDDVAYGVTAEEELVHEFEDGTELKFNILSDNGITSINEDGVAVTDSQGQALTDYEANTDYDFYYTTKGKDSTIVIKVNEAESTEESKKDDTSKEESTDKKDDSSKDESTDSTTEETSKKTSGLNIDFSRTDLTDEEQAIMDDYKNGLYDEHLEDRKAKAEETGLDKYCDSDYWLTKAYFKKYHPLMLSFDGCVILDPYTAGKDKSSVIDLGSISVNSNSRSGELTVTNMQLITVTESSTGYVIYNGVWTLSNGTTAFCAQGLMAGPVTGDTTTAPTEIDNANLRKVLYYGAGGPASTYLSNYVSSLGLDASTTAYVFTDELTSMAYSGYCNSQLSSNSYWWNKYVSNVWNYITSLPDPSGYKAYGAQTIGTGTNWQGNTVNKQFLVYGIYSPKGKLKLKKSSSNTDITNNNSLYSLEDAVYGVYSDSGCKNPVGTLTTDANGNTGEIEVDTGTYYVKEKTSPKGYSLDQTVHSIYVNADQTNTLNVSDCPQSDPVGVLLGKIDKDTNKNKPQGSASLEGAEFTVKYYDVQSDTDPSEDGEEAVRTWVIKTDEDGYCELSKDYLVSGDDFYYNGTSAPSLPLGTITIQETKAPEGYYIDDTVFVRQITSDGSADNVYTYNQPEVKEEIISGKFQLTKFTTDADKSEIVTPEVGAKFIAVLEKYYTEAGEDIEKALELAKENGTEKEYAELTTDSDGIAKSSDLAYGTYVVKQVSVGTNATETWELADAFKFIVSEQDGEAYVYGQLSSGSEISANSDGTVHYLINNIPVTSGVKVVKKDADTGKVVTLNNTTFKIKKLDENGNPVTNYSKTTIRTDSEGYISMKIGLKWVDTFVTNADNRLSFAEDVANLFGSTYEADGTEEKGTVALPIALPTGDYQIEETNAPKGYLLTNNGKFTISKSTIVGTDDDGQPLLNVVLSDEKPLGQVVLNKSFDSEKKMHGKVSFNLIATQDIIDPADGSTIYNEGDIVGTYDLDEDTNTITVKDLPLQDGKASYKFVEATTYENYKLNTTEIPFEYEIKDQTTKFYLDTVSATNETIKISTQALNAKTDTNEFNSAKEITVTDVVSYDGLEKGKEYTMHGVLVDKKTGEIVKDSEGNAVEGYKKFTADDVTGEVKVKISLDASELGGGNYVVYEYLLNTSSEGHEGCIIAEHEDITDTNQTIKILASEIVSLAKSTNGTHEQQVTEGDLTVTDTVTYDNLVPNQTYKLVGTLMDQETGEPLYDNDGEVITAEAEFTPEDYEGETDVTFTFDATNIKAGTHGVFFETLYEVDTDKDGVTKTIEVASHSNLNDKNQAIDFIDVHTTATSENGTNEQQETTKKITLTDTVSYEGLKVGKDYTVKGTLMDKATGFVLTDSEGNEITSEVTFTPEETDGEVEVTFEFDGSVVKSGDDIVVFESLERNGIEVATHSDIEDKGQTIHITNVHTTATSEKDNHTALAGEKITITDSVAYENLEVGKEYTVKGTLMDKDTNEPVIDADGNKVVAEKTFTPKEKDGTVELVYTLNSSDLAGKTTVVFEDLYKDDKKVATHSDINDENQTIKFKDFEIQVNKVDSITKKNITSKDFEFTMYKDKECKEVETTIAGDTTSGTATFSVKKGTWYIKETKAPKGYKLSKEVIKVEVKDDKMYVNDKEVDTDSDYLYSFIYQDALLPSYVNTSTSTNAMTYVGGIGVASAGIAYAIYELEKKKKQK